MLCYETENTRVFLRALSVIIVFVFRSVPFALRHTTEVPACGTRPSESFRSVRIAVAGDERLASSSREKIFSFAEFFLGAFTRDHDRTSGRGLGLGHGTGARAREDGTREHSLEQEGAGPRVISLNLL